MQRTAHVCLNEQSLPILCTVEDMELEVNDFCVFQDAEGVEQTGFLNTGPRNGCRPRTGFAKWEKALHDNLLHGIPFQLRSQGAPDQTAATA